MGKHNHTGREKNIRAAVFLNVGFTVLEFLGGLWTNSLAILSDALHDLGDSITLATSWVAERGARRAPDRKRTFGYQRLSLFAALFSAVVLSGGSLFILSRAVPRLLHPEHVNASGMIGLAIVGLLFNGAAFFRLRGGQSLNERVLSWHILEDVLGWGVILVGSVIIRFWDNHLIDPLMTVGYTLFILWGVVRNLKETFNILLQGVPAHIDLDGIRSGLLALEGVQGVHDVHVWSLEGETDIFTGHVVVEENLSRRPEALIRQIKEELRQHHIEHSTIELEGPDSCSGIECQNGL
jgi:cobalt-zinc-cadmium efflux system protein